MSVEEINEAARALIEGEEKFVSQGKENKGGGKKKKNSNGEKKTHTFFFITDFEWRETGLSSQF